jgi:hypothetical protein
MYRPIALGLAMLAGGVIGAVAVNGLHAQGQTPGAPTPQCSGTMEQGITCLEGLITALDAKLSAALEIKATRDEITNISLRIGTLEKRVGTLEKLLADQKK